MKLETLISAMRECELTVGFMETKLVNYKKLKIPVDAIPQMKRRHHRRVRQAEKLHSRILAKFADLKNRIREVEHEAFGGGPGPI